MSRSFDIVTESPASVEQIHAAFGREDYWLARIAAGDATTTLDSLIVDADTRCQCAPPSTWVANYYPD